MADQPNGLGWFSRVKMEQQFGSSDSSLLSTFSQFILAASMINGFLFLCCRLFDFIRLILSLFVLPGTPLRTFGNPSKTWAIVTGASDGIGREYALHLARAGYSTLLVSRTASKLDAVAAEIKTKFNTPVKTLVMDFAAHGENDSDYTRLQTLVDDDGGLDIAILINNVGLSHSIPVPFLQTPSEEMDGIIEVNCRATLKVTRIVARGMVERKRGLILTMGSFGGLVPTPLLATYSGSKAFLQQWSTALGSELAPHNVTVELVQSHLVTSNMSKIRRSSALVPTPRQFVKATMGTIGRSGGAQGWAYTSTPWWAHAVLQFVMAQTVTVGNTGLLWWNRRSHEDIRKRALRKMEREKLKKKGS